MHTKDYATQLPHPRYRCSKCGLNAVVHCLGCDNNERGLRPSLVEPDADADYAGCAEIIRGFAIIGDMRATTRKSLAKLRVTHVVCLAEDDPEEVEKKKDKQIAKRKGKRHMALEAPPYTCLHLFRRLVGTDREEEFGSKEKRGSGPSGSSESSSSSEDEYLTGIRKPKNNTPKEKAAINYQDLESCTGLLEEYFDAIFDFVDSARGCTGNRVLFCSSIRTLAGALAASYIIRCDALPFETAWGAVHTWVSSGKQTDVLPSGLESELKALAGRYSLGCLYCEPCYEVAHSSLLQDTDQPATLNGASTASVSHDTNYVIDLSGVSEENDIIDEIFKCQNTDNESVTAITISGAKLGSGGINALGKVLHDCPLVTALDLRGVELGDDGGACLIDALVHGRSWSLNFTSCDIGERTLVRLRDALITESIIIRELNLGSNPGITHGVICKLLKVPLDGGTFLRGLQHLYISEVSGEDDGSMGDTFCTFLSDPDSCGMSRLEVCNIGLIGPSLRGIGAGIGANTSLRSLSLVGSVFGRSGAKHLAAGFTNNTELQELDVSGSVLGTGGVKLLCDAVAEHKNVHKLDISNIRLGADGADAVGQMLRRSSRLTHINLSNCDIGIMTINAVADGIEGSSSLESVNMSNNNLFETGGKRLAPAISGAPRLAYIDLSFTSLTKNCVALWLRECDARTAPVHQAGGVELLINLAGNPHVEDVSMPHLRRNGLSVRFLH